MTDRIRLQARDLRLAYGDNVVVDGLDLDVLDGTVSAVIGPNGCGKSTLLRALARLMPATRGHVLLDGKWIDKLPTREVAKILGVLPQAPIAPEGLTVADLIARGRHPHQTWYRQWSSDDEAAVAEALSWTGLTELAERTIDELSGGQRQRAWISMALAQGTELLLLDEPTTFLDLAHQVDVLDLVERLHTEAGRTVVMVLHDLNMAARYAQRLIAMRDGKIIAQGAPGDVLTEPLLREVFELDAHVLTDPIAGTPLVVPVGRRNRQAADPEVPATTVTTTFAASPAGTATAFPATITHKLGSAVIPEEPKRIVALSVQDADIVVALGVLPVAMTKHLYGTDGGHTQWLASKPGVASVELLDEDDGGAVPLAKVAALNPDLILASRYLGIDAQYDKLARIAPVIAHQQERLTRSWQEQTMVIGRALGREEQARRVVSEVEARISEVRLGHPEFEGKTATYSIHFESDAIRTINSTRDYAAEILNDLGLSLPPAVTTLQGDDGARIGLEQIGTLDADVLIMSYASDDLRASLESNPVFQAVPAVRDRHYLPASLDATSALHLPSVLSIPYGLDQLEPGLAKALG